MYSNPFNKIKITVIIGMLNNFLQCFQFVDRYLITMNSKKVKQPQRQETINTCAKQCTNKEKLVDNIMERSFSHNYFVMIILM